MGLFYLYNLLWAAFASGPKIPFHLEFAPMERPDSRQLVRLSGRKPISAGRPVLRWPRLHGAATPRRVRRTVRA